MGEAAQRRLARCVFLLFCLTPFLGVLGWSVVWALPSHVTRIENRLRDKLGVVVIIDQIAHPRPNELELGGVQLKDPETQALLGSINQLAIRWERRKLKLEADVLTVSDDQRARLWDLLHTHVVQQNTLDDRAVQFNVRRVNITTRTDQFLYDVAGTAWTTNEKVQATVSCELTEFAGQPRFEIRLLRDRSASPLQTQIHIDTKQQSLPLALFSPAVAAKLGGASRLNGRLWVMWRTDDWRAKFLGTLEEIELDGLTKCASDAYTMTGRGSIQLEAEFTSRQLTQAVGSLEFVDGTIDAKLIRRLVETSILRAPQPNAPHSTVADGVAYKIFALEFDHDQGVVTLKGHCPQNIAQTTPRPVVINVRGDTLLLNTSRDYSAHLLKCLRIRPEK